MFRLLWKTTLVSIIAVLGGFLWFVSTMPPQTVNYNTPTDAIVVLTGSVGRIQEGIELFQQGKAKYLYISGVNPRVTKEALFKNSKLNPQILECCVIIEHEAKDTEGNARETAKWVQEKGLRSLRLVTADYHVRRSLLQFRSYLPDLMIVAHPIKTEAVVLEHRWEDWKTLKVLFKEYTKWVVARVIVLQRV
jgi:uncharacterized SAM-binding protein YcdF (DUF218 family)